jgi:hypothetical protein
MSYESTVVLSTTWRASMKIIVLTLILSSSMMLLTALLMAASDAASQNIPVQPASIEMPDKQPHIDHVGMGRNQPLP